VIEYIEEEHDDECKGVDIYSSKTTTWICKESKWGPNTCVTIERSEEMRSSETMYLNGCLHIMGYSGVFPQILVVDMEIDMEENSLPTWFFTLHPLSSGSLVCMYCSWSQYVQTFNMDP
jgi:hypothetical protein